MNFIIRLLDAIGPRLGGYQDYFEQFIKGHGGTFQQRGKWELESSYILRLNKQAFNIICDCLIADIEAMEKETE